MNELENERFLVFCINEELYASPLLEFHEVVEMIKPKPVPNMPEHFSGMINLRGVIVAIIDLRKKMGIHEKYMGKQTMLICETETGIIGASIDRVESVIHIDPATIQDVKIEGKIALEYLRGFVNHEGKIITLVDVKSFLSEQDKQFIEISA